ncbi:HAD family hydrolase [Desulfobotulus mexicanus]|uniref:HAD hydrolase family protein n=1 Tax=Desulfobotulus mexicanus TaxID=2586642 RepID=A0A5S5ME66_9BACT|nr:HAD hydrolase family protein [Desulfobotulus mexicanus]TYT74004.1 HAD hydrolase family protein [Desulfobotulus mexicanus]
MFTINIPGFGKIEADHLVLDYNGTLAQDGQLLDGVKERLQHLSEDIKIHVITADTFGSVKKALNGLPLSIVSIPPGNQGQAKKEYVESLRKEKVIAMGNGRNDVAMLQTARIGIAIMMKEGTSSQALMQADITSSHICDALDLLLHPLRLTATLRD